MSCDMSVSIHRSKNGLNLVIFRYLNESNEFDYMMRASELIENQY